MKGLRTTPGINLAEHAGFCFGVRRAVEKAESFAPAVTLGPIINNAQAVQMLEEKGVRASITRKLYRGGHGWQVWRESLRDFLPLIFKEE